MTKNKEILKLYGQYSVELAQQLKSGMTLNTEEQSLVENHLLIVQLAMLMTKQGESKKSPSQRGS